MFCPQCGKKNQEAVSYCIYCGGKLPISDVSINANDGSDYTPKVAVKSNISNATPDVYTKLGGWLAVIAYGRLVSVILELIVCIVVIFSSTCFEYYPNGNRNFIGLANFARAAASTQITFYAILCYGGLFIFLLYILHACSSIGMYRKVRHKKANCIGFYLVSAALISCATVVGLVVGFLLIKQNPFILAQSPYMMQIMPIVVVAVLLLLDAIISLPIFSTYFKTSIRVKVYFDAKQ